MLNEWRSPCRTMSRRLSVSYDDGVDDVHRYPEFRPAVAAAARSRRGRRVEGVAARDRLSEIRGARRRGGALRQRRRYAARVHAAAYVRAVRIRGGAHRTRQRRVERARRRDAHVRPRRRDRRNGDRRSREERRRRRRCASRRDARLARRSSRRRLAAVSRLAALGRGQRVRAAARADRLRDSVRTARRGIGHARAEARAVRDRRQPDRRARCAMARNSRRPTRICARST